ncbi:hypothetical protein APTSU1_000947800 [Apodemus speciosus]|uniref:Uncharacterized protein n=1 Tax=Apodemus speciosus TaxID=105296 RepID=A0ABQ0F5A0_APOSI
MIAVFLYHRGFWDIVTILKDNLFSFKLNYNPWDCVVNDLVVEEN